MYYRVTTIAVGSSTLDKRLQERRVHYIEADSLQEVIVHPVLAQEGRDLFGIDMTTEEELAIIENIHPRSTKQ